jgi:hypothetical protein
MRKNIVIVLILACALSFAGCSTKNNDVIIDNNNDSSSNISDEIATENDNNDALNASTDDIELYTITGRYCISTTGRNILLSKDNGAICITPANNDKLFSDLEIGDEIEISINDVAETYPAQASVYDCTLIQKGTANDLDYDEIQDLINLGWEFPFDLEYNQAAIDVTIITFSVVDNEENIYSLTADEANTIKALLDNREWTSETGECINDFVLNVNGNEFYYHSDCGTFNDNKYKQHCTLSEDDKEVVDTILFSKLVVY